MSDAWAPVHHEQIDDEADQGQGQGGAKPRTPAAKKSDLASEHVPMALSLAIPADFIATMSAVAGAMSEVASAMADNTKAMKELVAQMKKQRGGGETGI